MIRFVLAGACAAAAAIAVLAPPNREASPIGAPAAKGDVVLEWNVTALETTASAPFNPPLESRNLAIVHAAMFDAVNSIEREFRHYAVDLHPKAEALPEAAAAAAAHLALVRLYPAQQATLDAAYAASLASVAEGPARANGILVGETVASEILARRAGDGADAAIVFSVHAGDPGGRLDSDAARLPARARPRLGLGEGLLPGIRIAVSSRSASDAGEPEVRA